VKIAAGTLGTERGKVFDLEISGFFEVVVVGNEIGTFLSVSNRG
jgi:hypothetical protein